MNIRCLRTKEELHALAPCWNELLQRSSSNGIFLTWEWVLTWWEAFGGRFKLLLLVAEADGGKLVGIAPTMIGRLRSPTGLSFRCLMLVGQQGDTLAEYLDFITERGREEEITAAFSRHLLTKLAADWDCVFFERILTTSPNLATLTKQFGGNRDHELKSLCVTLGGTWQEFLAAKSRNFRNQWKNSWNRLQGEGKVEFLFGGKDLPLALALAEVSRLHRERWAEKSGSFRTETYLQFHEKLCERLHPNGWLLLLLLSVNGRNVAARYDYIYAGKLWCMQGGWSPEYAGKRVGTLLTGKVIEWGITHGMSEYDFLGGDSDYKRRWASDERVMINLTAANPKTFRGRLWRWNHALESFARRVKDILRRPPKQTSSVAAD